MWPICELFVMLQALLNISWIQFMLIKIRMKKAQCPERVFLCIYWNFQIIKWVVALSPLGASEFMHCVPFDILVCFLDAYSWICYLVFFTNILILWRNSVSSCYYNFIYAWMTAWVGLFHLSICFNTVGWVFLDAGVREANRGSRCIGICPGGNANILVKYA